MANRVIASQKEQFDREIAAYRGDDPLKLRYDFLLWLDSNFGKDKVIDLFTSTLEEALNTHWDDARYKEDNRLIELQMIYATLQPNPLKMYQSYYDRGVAQNSSVLYVNWANHLAAAGDFEGADKIFKMGTEKTSSTMKTELIKAFEKFLAVVGRKYLDGEIPAKKEVQCTKCNVQQTTAPAPAAEDVQTLEMNPGQAGCYDDFQTAVAYFEPPDKSIRMYPKDKVYKDPGKEYSLEEIKAEEYFEKLRKKEQQEAQKLKEKAKKSIMSFDPPFEADPVMKEGAFPTPLLPCSGKEDSIAAQSFTTRTKLAMHLVQDMWSSPTPEVQPPMIPKTEENKPKSAFPIYMDDNPETPKAAEKKPLAPFQVFADSPNEVAKNNKNPVSLSVKSSTAKKNGLQTKPKVLSERKLKDEEIQEEPKAGVKQQLHFESDNANEMLANKLSETSVSDPIAPFQPFGGIKPLFPVEQGKDDFSDVTCNTKAFNFALPSSTPVQQRKSLAPYHSAHQNSGSNIPQDERPSYQTQQNLSVILEASKERCSSSGSSTGSSQPRTPGFPAKTNVKTLSNLSGLSSCSGTVHRGSASGNRSFTWMPNRKSQTNLSLETPNHSQSNDELHPAKTYTCSFLKFRLSSEKWSALKSIKENYFHDQSKSKIDSFKSTPESNKSYKRSPFLSVPFAEKQNIAPTPELLTPYKPKNENNIFKQFDALLRCRPQTLGASVSVVRDTINTKQSENFSENGDHTSLPRDLCSTTNMKSSHILKAADSNLISSDPRIRNKLKRKSYRLSGGLLAVKCTTAVDSKRNHCEAKAKIKAKRKSSNSKRKPASTGDSLTLATSRSRQCSQDSLHAHKESLCESGLKLTEPMGCCEPKAMDQSGRKNVCVSTAPDALQNRECSIRLSPIKIVDDFIHSSDYDLPIVECKRGRPRKKKSSKQYNSDSDKIISRKSSANSEDSPFTLVNFRKENTKIDLKRRLNAESGTVNLSEPQGKYKRNAGRTKSNVNLNNQLNKRVKRRTSLANNYETRTSSVTCPTKSKPDVVKQVEDSISHIYVPGSIPYCGIVTRSKSCYKTPINKKKIMAGSESCPAHMSEPVASHGMTQTRTSSVTCSEKSIPDVVKQVEDSNSDILVSGSIPNCGIVTRSCYKTPINKKKIMAGSESCPAYMSEPVASQGMTQTRTSSVTCPEKSKLDVVKQVEDSISNIHVSGSIPNCGIVTRSRYKTPINKRKIMAGSESCPAHMSEPVASHGMTQTRTSSVTCPEKSKPDVVKQVEDSISNIHVSGSIPNCGIVTRSCYKTPINKRKIMAGSESCPAHMSEPVASQGMTVKSQSGSFTTPLPREYELRSKSHGWSCTYYWMGCCQSRECVPYVPKQLSNDIDPFCPAMNEKLLSFLNFPQHHHADGYMVVNSNLPSVTKNLRLGNDVFTTYGDLGKGAYARVVKASTENANLALKIEKPACKWEFYIAREIQKRLDSKARSAFMDIKTAYIFTNGSVLATEWAKHGSLLNIINQYKKQTGKVLEPVLSHHFAIEVTRAVEYLHKCKIIHGDIKPDNFVVRSLPTVNETEPCLMLIDFGRSIDMTLFPDGTKFSRVVTTDGFQCTEMREQKSWTYQTDLFGLAGSIHCLLLGEYMKVVKKNDEWKLPKALPRNIKRDVWDPIFHQLLNVPSCEQLPNLTEIRKTLEASFANFNHYVKLQYFNQLSNIVTGK